MILPLGVSNLLTNIQTFFKYSRSRRASPIPELLGLKQGQELWLDRPSRAERGDTLAASLSYQRHLLLHSVPYPRPIADQDRGKSSGGCTIIALGWSILSLIDQVNVLLPCVALHLVIDRFL